MLKIYKTDMDTNQLNEIKEFEKGSWINMINPSEKEIKKVCQALNIGENFIRYPLDLEEKARIDIEDDIKLFLMDVPILENTEGEKLYSTMPLGMIAIRDDYFITVSLNKNGIISEFEDNKLKNFFTYKKTRFLIQMFYTNASNYLNILKQINKEAETNVIKLQKSMKNKELIKLLHLENSLVYVATSLRSNEIVMEKTLSGKAIKLYEEDEDILDDAIIENKQAIEMCKIYSDILSGTMDAYASIISNNVNAVMKFLAAITIVLSLPTLVASFWGMNVGLPLQGQPYGFAIVVLLSIGISILAAWWLKKKDML